MGMERNETIETEFHANQMIFTFPRKLHNDFFLSFYNNLIFKQQNKGKTNTHKWLIVKLYDCTCVEENYDFLIIHDKLCCHNIPKNGMVDRS